MKLNKRMFSEALAGGRGLILLRRWRVRVHRGVRISGPGTLLISRGSRFDRNVRIWVGPGAVLQLGTGVSIGEDTIINVKELVQIGSGTQVSWRVQILDTDFHQVRREDGSVSPAASPVLIGDRVLVGCSAIILKGTSIGPDSIIGAGALLSGQQVPPKVVMAGNPAVVRGSVSGWIG